MSSSFSPPSLVRRLTRENKTMGPRLAQLEFQNLSKELESTNLFELQIDFPEVQTPPAITLPTITSFPSAQRLTPLSVTLGRTAWATDPEALPIVGIWVPDRDHAELRTALLALLRKHYIEPFARYVFLCEAMRPIPFLGRYEFTYEYVGQQDPIQVAQRMRLRYGMIQLRDLLSGAAIWKGISNPLPSTG